MLKHDEQAHLKQTPCQACNTTSLANADLAKECAVHASVWRDIADTVNDSEKTQYVSLHDSNIAAMQSLLERAARALGYEGEFK